MLSPQQVPSQPFSKIALSCSGGGYRATSFHLGSMAYLNRLLYKGKPLLENVEMISTVSGGTFTGVVYALQKQQGKSFEEIYHFLVDKLNTVDLLKDGIDKLNPDEVLLNKYKQKNLINIMAEAYDRHFTGGATMSIFNDMGSHIKHVVFNSTELKNAINFRFKNNERYGYSGNYYLHVCKELVEEVKLSDVMAASSCFPGGFEPLRWPQDFVHDDAPKLKINAAIETPIGIMDGGIYDNQGIQSILNYGKDDPTPYFDLVIISDVASPYMEAYKPSAEQPKTGIRKMTLKKAKRAAGIISMTINIMLLSVVALGITLICMNRDNMAMGNVSWILTILASLTFLVKVGLSYGIRSALSSVTKPITDHLGPFYLQRLKRFDIENLSLHRAEPLLLDRVNSLITLLMDVFLKVIRRLNYAKIYEDNRYTYRVVSNLIKELTEEDFNNKREREQKNEEQKEPDLVKNSILRGSYDQAVGGEISDIAQYASGFGTTLWFEDSVKLNDMLDKLVATGQFTMCYNILEYLERIKFETESGFEQLDVQTQTDINNLYIQCLADWNRFKNDPMFLVNEMAK